MKGMIGTQTMVMILLTWLWAHSGLSWWIYICALLFGMIINLITEKSTKLKEE